MLPKKSKPKCVIYLRVSTDDQRTEGLSIDVQESLCKRKAEAEGYQVLEVINDAGISGYKDSRPGINKIRQLVEVKAIDAVVALESSRLFRNAISDRAFRNLAFKSEVKILYVSEESPRDSADSKMHSGIKAEFNEYFRNLVSDKVKQVAYAKAEAGYFPSIPPLGYKNAENPDHSLPRYARRIIIPDPISAPVITELFQLYSTGIYNVYDLTDRLNDKGIRTHRGYKVASSVVYNILRNRIYLGEVRWGKIHVRQGKQIGRASCRERV